MNWQRLQALVWLRWRLSRNQWRRDSQVGAVLTLIFLAVCLGLGVAGGVAGFWGGAWGLAKLDPFKIMLVWDGLVAMFLMFWTVGIVVELQRQDIIDLSRLLHLPVSLWEVFLLNYVASHVSFGLAMMLPGMLGLAAGLVVGRGWAMLALFPLVLAFFFMITAWTYCLRGWLASLMINKRRRRAIIMGITMAFVLASQLPNLMINVFPSRKYFAPRRSSPPIARNNAGQTGPEAPANQSGGDNRAALENRRSFKEDKEIIIRWVEQVHPFIPFLWLPYGARGLAQGNAQPALWGALALFALGVWGLARAYRITLRYCQGGEVNTLAAAPSPSAKPVVKSTRKPMVEWTLPLVPDTAAAVTFAGLRSMSRAPEIKMALANNVIVFIILFASLLLRKSGAMPAVAKPFMSASAVTMTFLGLFPLMLNHFGYDRGGFRALVLLPTPRFHILLGKNMALLPVALLMFLFYFAVVVLLIHPPASTVLAAGLEFAAAFLFLSALGNLVSIAAPFRVSPNSMKPAKTNGTTQLLIIAVHMMFPLAMSLFFVPPALGWLFDYLHWLPGTAVMLASAFVLVLLSGLVYWRMLEPLGGFLQRREQAILQVVSREVE